VECQWEECSYRIESLNILLFLISSLDEAISGIQKKLGEKITDLDEVRQNIGKILDHLSKSLDQELPTLPTQGINKLDKLVKKKRDQEWYQLRQDVDDMRMHLGGTIEDLVTELEDFKFRLKALAVEVSQSRVVVRYIRSSLLYTIWKLHLKLIQRCQ